MYQKNANYTEEDLKELHNDIDKEMNGLEGIIHTANTEIIQEMNN